MLFYKFIVLIYELKYRKEMIFMIKTKKRTRIISFVLCLVMTVVLFAQTIPVHAASEDRLYQRGYDDYVLYSFSSSAFVPYDESQYCYELAVL